MKKEKTPEEIEAHEAQKSFNRKYAGFKRTLKSFAVENGLRSLELRLEFLKEHPETELPKEIFTREETMECFADAIAEYKEDLKKKQAA